MAENFKIIVGNLGCEDARFWHKKYNIRQKLVFSKVISTCSEEHFLHFFKCPKLQNFQWALCLKFSAGLSKLHSTFQKNFLGKTISCSEKISAGLSKLGFDSAEEHFQEFFAKKINFFTLIRNFLEFWRKIFGRVVKTEFYVSGETFC